MNRSELIEAVADRLEVRRQEAADAVEAVIETIKAEVAKGEKVAISGFGIFEQFQRSARTMKSPFDGRTIKVKAKPVPKFKAGAEFKAFVENPRAALKKAQASAKKAQASAKKAPAKTAAAAKKTTTAAKTAAKAAPAKDEPKPAPKAEGAPAGDGKPAETPKPTPQNGGSAAMSR